MSDPLESPEDDDATAPRSGGPSFEPDPFAFPPPGLSGLLTLSGFLLLVMVLAPLATMGHGVLGMSLGLVVGFGLVGTWAAQRVPAPTERRIGLVGVSWSALGLVLWLAPLAFWLSELDNLAAELVPRPPPVAVDEAPDDGDSTLRLVEVALFAILLRPVVEEFFFRGVVQQGAVAALGMRGGVLLQTLLFTLVRSMTGAGSGYALLSLMSQALVEGLLLGRLRLATGSILPGILLQGIINAVGIGALAFAESLPIEGLNLQDGHMGAAWLIPSALSIAVGLRALETRLRSAEPLPPAAPPEPAEDDDFYG